MSRVIICILLIASSFCYGQNINSGLVIGINTSQVSFDNLSGFNKIGVRSGAFINQNFKTFQGQIELLYINKGSREQIDSDSYNEGYKLNLNYIELPISLKKNVYKNIDGELGMSIGYLLHWSETYNGYDNYGDKINQIEYSAHIGFEYQIRKNLHFNTRISNSIAPARSDKSSNLHRWYHGQYNTSISFIVYYYFLKT